MRIRDDEAADEPVLNLTSLIDVVFLLLVFFMVTTTFLKPEQEIEIDLPTAESGTPLEVEPDELVIHVTKDGHYALAGAEITRDALEQALERAARRDPETAVIIRGDRATRHESIVAVMDACGRAGLSNLSVGTIQGS